MAAGRRRIDLGEFLEDLRLHLRRNADAGVFDTQFQDRLTIRDSLGGDLDMHMALLCELDGIAKEVRDDLPEAARITHEGMHYLLVARDDEFDILFRGRGRQKRCDILDRLDRIERRLPELQLAGIDLREVENVIDDGEQRIARFHHDVDEGLLPAVELGFGQEFGHAEYAIHRGADFMAHIGEEVGLRLVGGFAARKQHFKLGFAGLELGEIGEHDHAAAITPEGRFQLDPGLAGNKEICRNRVCALQCRLPLLQDRLRVGTEIAACRTIFENRPPAFTFDQQSLGQIEDAAERGIDLGDPSLFDHQQTLGHHPHGFLDEEAKPLQLLLRRRDFSLALAHLGEV